MPTWGGHSVYNRVVQSCSALASVPVGLTKVESSLTFLSDTDCLDIRAGQPDDHLAQMAAAKKEAFKSHNGDSIVAWICTSMSELTNHPLVTSARPGNFYRFRNGRVSLYTDFSFKTSVEYK